MILRTSCIALVACCFSCAAAAEPVIVDGTVDAAYGAPLAVQGTQTQAWGDANLGLPGPANGSELDAAHAIVSDGVLYVALTGNLLTMGNPVDFGLLAHSLELFVDCAPGGQNTLRADNSWGGGDNLAGFTFDPGFEPDRWFTCAGALSDDYDPHSTYTLSAGSMDLPTAAPGAGIVLGATGALGPGTLTGGSNPYGIRVTIDDRNVAGVGAGCDAGSGEGVPTGVEWAIPLAALGNPTGDIRICALVSEHRHRDVTNQVLAPVPPGTCWPGASLAAIPGEQFFVVRIPTAARAASWGAIKSAYR